MVKRFIKYYKNYRLMFALDMICALFAALISLFYPVITRKMINTYIPNGNIKMVIILSAVLLLVYILKAFLNYFIQRYGHNVGTRIQADMRRDLFSHMQTLPLSFFDKNKTGALLSRITSDLFEVSELAHHGPEDLFLSLVLLIGSFVLMAGINIWFTLIVFASIPVLLIFVIKKRFKMMNAFKGMRKENAAINADIENSITGIRVSKAYTNEIYESDKFEIYNRRYVSSRDEAMKAMAEFSSGTTFIGDFLYMIVLLSGAIFMLGGLINFADLTAFIIYVSVFMDPIKRIVSLSEQLQNGMTGFQRFCEIMDTPSEPDNEGAVELKEVLGEIEFSDVSFSYSEGKEILSDISFKIERGKTLALVGPSGGGKTTVCNILPRFYEISEGSVTIDGEDIRSYTRASLRRKIGIVSQDVFLFDTTIYENIAFGRLDATKEEVYEAARLAGIADYIESLPDGYDTEVGERGVRLSGGQKQRIAIARVFLKNPPILILDEATSALDNVTENMICESLNKLSEGRTTIVVAHRLSTVKSADKIIVMTDEGISETGTHEELLSSGGIYKTLFESQFKK
ncbi:MAG: ABC transporter ATP-binding protein [Oscillospiraceae bacterium]|nr:ABC transporter ATP-binding protein [Oscillospiraceae bacterium]